jgi:hypothetical protein
MSVEMTLKHTAFPQWFDNYENTTPSPADIFVIFPFPLGLEDTI